MKSYGHPNSANLPPVLGESACAILRAIDAEQPLPRFRPEDLALVAEFFDCRAAAASLRFLDCDVVVCDNPNYTAAAVFWRESPYATVDAEAAWRIEQRIRQGGLSADIAIERTIGQCPRPVMSEYELRNLEREADHHVLTLEHGS